MTTPVGSAAGTGIWVPIAATICVTEATFRAFTATAALFGATFVEERAWWNMDADGLTEVQAIQKAVAERVFGWNVETDPRFVGGFVGYHAVNPGVLLRVPNYPTDLGDAAAVWAWIRERWAKDRQDTKYDVSLALSQMKSETVRPYGILFWPWFFFEADVPMTLCRVALALLDAEEAKP
jgi:hypothetical protein